jgi:hypothetical protein
VLRAKSASSHSLLLLYVSPTLLSFFLLPFSGDLILVALFLDYLVIFIIALHLFYPMLLDIARRFAFHQKRER